MKKPLKTAAHYSLVLAVLVSLFCASLFLAGLVSAGLQPKIDRNVNLSMDQIEKEGLYPQNFDSKDYTMRMDNFTVMIMLQECVTMNTAENPSSIFTNPRLSKKYDVLICDDEAFSNQAQSTRELTQTHEGNAFYTYYWMGYRIIYRLLLCLMPYQDIRSVVGFAFIMLFIAAAMAIRKLTGSYAVPVCFVASVALMNVPIISSDIQFATVFLIMFSGIILLCVLLTSERYENLSAKKKTIAICDFFFVLGAITQFFDFYTVPVITLCFPLTVKLSTEQDSTSKEAVRSTVRVALSWFGGYVLVWLARLLLVELFTDKTAISGAFMKVASWTGIVDDGIHSQYTVLYATYIVLKQLLTKQSIFCIALSCVVYATIAARAVRRGALRKPRHVFLLTAAFPIIWTIVASRATGNHFWFQYRLISGSVFAFAVFAVEMLPAFKIPFFRPALDDDVKKEGETFHGNDSIL